MPSANQTQITTKSPGQRKALHTTGGATQVPCPAVVLPADIQPVEAAPTPAPALPTTVSITRWKSHRRPRKPDTQGPQGGLTLSLLSGIGSEEDFPQDPFL